MELYKDSQTGSISGRVADQAGFEVQNVQVTVTNAQNQAFGRTTTNVIGDYQIDGLAPGAYTISIVAPAGYQNPEPIKNIEVHAGKITPLGVIVLVATDRLLPIELNLISTLASSLQTSGVVKKLREIVRERLQEKGLDIRNLTGDIPGDVRRYIENVLSIGEPKFAMGEAQDLATEAIARAHGVANDIRKERMRQARFTFNAALSLAVLGVLIIFAGVGLLLFTDTVTSGSVTAGVGAITEVVSTILFRLNKETNNRLDEVGRDLSAIEISRIAMTFIGEITDPIKKDDAINEVAKSLRGQGGTYKAKQASI